MIKNNIDNNQKMTGQKSCHYELILMDCNMPFMDGYETTQKIRDLFFRERLQQPIISAVTGHTD
jgi:CheY-like chemotaxis protein